MRFVSIATWTWVDPVSWPFWPCLSINSCLASLVRAMVLLSVQSSPRSPHGVKEEHGRPRSRSARNRTCRRACDTVSHARPRSTSGAPSRPPREPDRAGDSPLPVAPRAQRAAARSLVPRAPIGARVRHPAPLCGDGGAASRRPRGRSRAEALVALVRGRDRRVRHAPGPGTSGRRSPGRRPDEGRCARRVPRALPPLGRPRSRRGGRRPRPDGIIPGVRLYGDLAPWFHLLTAPPDYAGEAERYRRLIVGAVPDAGTLLELGSGGGNNASHLKEHFSCTLSDLSPQM